MVVRVVFEYNRGGPSCITSHSPPPEYVLLHVLNNFSKALIVKDLQNHARLEIHGIGNDRHLRELILLKCHIEIPLFTARWYVKCELRHLDCGIHHLAVRLLLTNNQRRICSFCLVETVVGVVVGVGGVGG